jgi:ADP-ribose pyrophosphatase
MLLVIHTGGTMESNRIKKLTPMTETKFLSLYDAEYKNKKGKDKHWIIASRKNYDTLIAQYYEGKEEKIDAVIIAALHKNSNSLVLIKQFRIPLNDYVYELPAGLLDANESIEEAVSRELKEETGLSLIEIDYKKLDITELAYELDRLIETIKESDFLGIEEKLINQLKVGHYYL